MSPTRFCPEAVAVPALTLGRGRGCDALSRVFPHGPSLPAYVQLPCWERRPLPAQVWAPADPSRRARSWTPPPHPICPPRAGVAVAPLLPCGASWGSGARTSRLLSSWAAPVWLFGCLSFSSHFRACCSVSADRAAGTARGWRRVCGSLWGAAAWLLRFRPMSAGLFALTSDL